MSSLYCHNSFLRTSLRRERRPGPATATSCTKTPRQRTPKHIGITVRKEMNCSGDSEIQHEIVRDTTLISSCFSDFRVVSWSIFIKTFCVLIFLYTTISSLYLSVIFFYKLPSLSISHTGSPYYCTSDVEYNNFRQCTRNFAYFSTLSIVLKRDNNKKANLCVVAVIFV